MVGEALLRKVGRRLPSGFRALAKKAYYSNRHWAHPAMKQFGTVQDLYYWVADENLDTLLVLQNYFSVFYPELETATDGTVTVYSRNGEYLGRKFFSVPHQGAARLTASGLLQDLDLSPEGGFGTLEVKMEIPEDVLRHIRPHRCLYFWDRFYMGYVNNRGQSCFVHGVDRTNIYRDGRSDPVRWYRPGNEYQWAPEIPVNIDEYEKFNVILINRTTATAQITLKLSDVNDESLSWTAEIPANGVHRFELTPENTAALEPRELRMLVSGLPTIYGRPVVFKEFANGSISAMHC